MVDIAISYLEQMQLSREGGSACVGACVGLSTRRNVEFDEVGKVDPATVN
jgi:hypothetical protein